jgi:hypothetical protein
MSEEVEIIDDQATEPVEAPSVTEDATSVAKKNSQFAEKRLSDKIAKLQAENDAYKAREQQRAKDEMTEIERANTEREEWKSKAETLLRKAVAAEFQLPPVLAARLVGSDEESLRADATELAKLVTKKAVGSSTNAARDTTGGQSTSTYKLSDAQKNPAITNTPEFRQALKEGRVDLLS